MNLPLILLGAYSVFVVALGLWSARLVRSSSDFFIAGRSLGPGLMFTSMIAANIGAGATVGVAGLAYRDGLSAWWWSGSAGFGSLVLAFWVGPRLWRLARDRGFYTTGDFLEARYGSTVRGVVTALIWLGSLSILAAQLLAGIGDHAVVRRLHGGKHFVADRLDGLGGHRVLSGVKKNEGAAW